VDTALPDEQPTDPRLVLGDAASSGEVRPWGAFVILDDGPLGKVKRITVDPGQRLSYQKHHRRKEHWFVVAGTAVVTLDDVDHEVVPGEAIDIPLGTAHRVRNPGTEPLVFVEVQQGDYFGEDDIVRLDDDYGRAD
jgi:mannose-6-phosphate isomerase